MFIDTATDGASVGIGSDMLTMREIADAFIAKAPGGPGSWIAGDICEERRHVLMRHLFSRRRGELSKGLKDALSRFCENWERPPGKYSISIVMVDRGTGTTTPLPCVKSHH